MHTCEPLASPGQETCKGQCGFSLEPATSAAPGRRGFAGPSMRDQLSKVFGNCHVYQRGHWSVSQDVGGGNQTSSHPWSPTVGWTTADSLVLFLTNVLLHTDRVNIT